MNDHDLYVEFDRISNNWVVHSLGSHFMELLTDLGSGIPYNVVFTGGPRDERTLNTWEVSFLPVVIKVE